MRLADLPVDKRTIVDARGTQVMGQVKVAARFRTAQRGPLDNPDRAGRWSRRKAERLRYEWAKRNWRLLMLVFSAGAVGGLLALLLPLPSGQFLCGVLMASGAWAAAGMVQTFSGAAPATMGHTAEQWTATDLASLRRRGWRIAHGVRLRAGADIDHVALGCGGLLVVETKWRSDGWSSRLADEQVNRAVAQVKRNARDLRLMLPTVQPVTAVVVLWGRPAPGEPLRLVDGVPVVPAASLTRWLSVFADAAPSVDVGTVDRAWDRLEDHIRRRDRYDEVNAPPPLTLERSVNEAVSGAVGGFTAAFALAVAIDMWSVPVCAAGALLAWRLGRHTKGRLVAGATAAGLGLLPVVLVGLVAADLAIRRLF